MDEATEFKKELKALLEKYNAEIYVLLDGDTFSVSSELCININNKEIMKVSDDCISHHDIKL